MRDQLEQHQTIVYLITIICAIFMGMFFPQFKIIAAALPFALAALMYSMFLQIPFFELKSALNHRKFIAALLISNYVIVPIVVACLIQFLPNQSTIIFGVLLVLLTPCIDYVIVFTHIGKGNAKLMLMATPLLFITQMLLLPIYIWLFLGSEFLSSITFIPFMESFFTLIVLPFIAALIMQKLEPKYSTAKICNQLSAWLPVPLMALVLWIIIASQINILLDSWQIIIQVIPIYAAFMVIMFILSYGLGKLFNLTIDAKRTLIYSSGTRNSLVVLAFAIALPKDQSMIVIAVIVTQTLIELLGEWIYVQITPKIQ